MLRTIITVFLIIQLNYGFGQSKAFPTVGELMPEFELSDVNYYSKKRIVNEDLAGTWYILDFWLEGCKPCIESFPKINDMVKEFKGKVEILQVGIGEEKLKRIYSEIRKKQNLNIPMAFDLNLASKWQIKMFPTLFIIDPKGYLRVITSEIDRDKLHELVNTGKNLFTSSRYKQYQPNDVTKLYFVNGNGGEDSTFLSRSVLAKTTSDYAANGIADLNLTSPSMKGRKIVSAINLKKGLFQISKASLLTLYNVAYFGQGRTSYGDSLYNDICWFSSRDNLNFYPILETKDSTDFKNRYTYSLKIPVDNATKKNMMRSMKLDLQKNFAYDARIENRRVAVSKLVILDKILAEKLKTKGGTKTIKSNEFLGYNLVNVPVSFLLNALWGENQFETILLDETGITYNIDVKINSSMKKLDELRLELQKVGLDLVKGEKEMKVLVIRDPKPEQAF